MPGRFYPKGAYREGASISEILELDNAALRKPCGGRGHCGKCRVTVSGEIPPPSEQEVRAISAADLSAGVRLACCVKPAGDFTVTLMAEGEMSVLSAFAGKTLSFQKTGYGLAVDIGTTTIVAAIYDLSNGDCAASVSRRNKQDRFGADVISRMAAAADGKRGELHNMLADQLSGMIREVCGEAGVTPREAVVTGNTTMLHFLTGLDTRGMASSPFTPASLFGYDVHSSSLFNDFDFTVYLPRCVGSFIGADVLCGVIASGMQTFGGVSMLADLGTNGEVVLAYKGRLYCASTAAGPAFEGAQIRQGMASVSGAISKVFTRGGRIRYKTIGGGKAEGICGSGILDAADVMLKTGAMDEMGTLDSTNRYVTDAGFAIGDYSGVALTQEDIRQVQLAKSAIYAGVMTLLREAEITPADVDTLYIAGGFGNYLNLNSAAGIGLIPAELAPAAKVIGNAALGGAFALLADDGMRERCRELADAAQIVGLAANPFFMNSYVENMLFPQKT